MSRYRFNFGGWRKPKPRKPRPLPRPRPEPRRSTRDKLVIPTEAPVPEVKVEAPDLGPIKGPRIPKPRPIDPELARRLRDRQRTYRRRRDLDTSVELEKLLKQKAMEKADLERKLQSCDNVIEELTKRVEALRAESVKDEMLEDVKFVDVRKNLREFGNAFKDMQQKRKASEWGNRVPKPYDPDPSGSLAALSKLKNVNMDNFKVNVPDAKAIAGLNEYLKGIREEVEEKAKAEVKHGRTSRDGSSEDIEANAFKEMVEKAEVEAKGLTVGEIESKE